MKPEIKEKWVEALRSGEYEQGVHGLRSGERYCCLGVLCELHHKQFNGEGWTTKTKINVGTFLGYCGETTFLPKEVTEWSDLSSLPVSSMGSLSKLNDTGKSFKEIADIIEKEL